ncbi:ribokinase [Paenarthrobacter sp. NyZ202]|uniref:ribokinase n=1 Tax=Paenarthrobacter sp. NyZ202 TaxID=3402689 RepID=UPI003CF263DB
MSRIAQASVVVVGSVNQDIVLTVPAMPKAGETQLATSSLTGGGGKGANQAVAASRAGARTQFIGSFGADTASADLRTLLEMESIEVRAHHSSKPSGRAVVLVDSAGDNSIIVDQGANSDLPADFIGKQLKDLRAHDVLVVQCELAQEAIEKALAVGKERMATVILNLAPYRHLNEMVLRCASIIVVNEAEAAALAERQLPLIDAGEVAASLSNSHGCTFVITLGGKGCVVAQGEEVNVVPAIQVERVVDTTGAGDAFVGALAAGLSKGAGLAPSIKAATAAAAYTVTSFGAQSFPIAGELSELAPGPLN